MHMTKAQILNYKSYLESEVIEFTPGFNIIVGQNNVGKTALVEALSFQATPRPHRSIKTAPSPETVVDQESSLRLSINLDYEEFINLIADERNESYFQFLPGVKQELQLATFGNAILHGMTIRANYSFAGRLQARLSFYNETHTTMELQKFDVNRTDMTIVSKGFSNGSMSTFEQQIVEKFKQRTYLFRAERMNVSEHDIRVDPNLHSNASNLAQVLHYLQTQDIIGFQEFNQLVRKVFPHIMQITAPAISGVTAQVKVWPVDPATRRKDLAVSLAESGTGIGQVLAILYVVLTSEFSRTIIIDEPQSFLHPGAIRTLFDILRSYPQHQYIVTTHSPTVISAADPQTLLLVTKSGAESSVQAIDVKETQNLRLYLAEIGARLSDVFGADNVLWVEGQTEELCFPLIVAEVAKVRLFGTVILGVKQVGDLEGKRARTVYEIYERLSQGSGLLPAAVGFIFDREGRTDQEQEDLTRQSGGLVIFLPRRMFENYLLNPGAIAAVYSAAIAEVVVPVDEEPLTPKSVEDIITWLEKNRWSQKYLAAAHHPSLEKWVEEVHGAKILEDLFKDLSEQRVEYHKVTHGVALTKWIIEHAAADLEELGELLKGVLSKAA